MFCFFPAFDIQTTQLSLHPANARGKSQQEKKKKREEKIDADLMHQLPVFLPSFAKNAMPNANAKLKEKEFVQVNNIDNKQEHLRRSPDKGRDTVERGARAAGRVSHYHVSAMY
jgi:hypothetical protein